MLEAAAVALLLILLYWPVLRDLGEDWITNPSYTQGLLIPPLAAWIGWTNRKRIFDGPAECDWRGMAVCAIACLLFLIGSLSAEFFAMRLSFVLQLTGLVWALGGLRRLRELAFPLVLLVTSIPPPALVYNAVAAPLQLFASKTAAITARQFGVALHQDGNIINLATISLGVDEACSGLHSLSALSVVGLLVGFVLNLNGGMRAFLFVVSVPIAIALNVVRVSGTAILADFNERFAMGFYHTFSGWLVFLAGFAFLFVIGRVFEEATRRSVELRPR